MICSYLPLQIRLVSFSGIVSRIIQSLKNSKFHSPVGHFHMPLHLHQVLFASAFQNTTATTASHVSIGSSSFYDKVSAQIPLGSPVYTL